jgi:hypothetical protein
MRHVRDRRVVVVFVVVVCVVTFVGAMRLRDDGRIEYNGRTYVDPGTVPASHLRDTPLRDTGVDRRGMDLLVPVSAGSGQPVMVVLRRDDGRYDVYNLSGGP